MLLASTVFATANPRFDAYIDDACSPRVYRLEDWLDCRHVIERYRIVKGAAFTTDSCIEAGNVRAWFLRWRAEYDVRAWTAIRDIECQLIGQQRHND